VNRLAELVDERKSAEGWSDGDIERRSGGVVRKAQISAWRKRGLTNFPETASIKALAAALGVTEHDVVLAAAVTVGLDVHPPETHVGRLMIAAGAERLTTAQRQAVLSVVRAMLEPGRAGQQPERPREVPPRAAARKRSARDGGDRGRRR
jgi:hypothetical protein